MSDQVYIEKRTDRQEGFVSLVVSALLMVILALITIGFARIMQREQRQAIDRHLSREALYAAESGINDVAAKIADPASDPVYDLPAKTSCDVNGLGPAGNGNLSADGAVAYTCALYDRSPSTLEYTATDQQSKITELNTESGNRLDTLTFAWGNSDTNPNNNLPANLPACGFSAQDLPPSRSNAPPVLKIDLTKIDARYVRDQMLQNTEYYYLLPCSGGPGATNIAFNPNVTQRGRAIQVPCTGTGLRPCTFTIDSMAPFNSSKYFLRLKPIYTGASITVEGTEQGGGKAAFNNAQVSIDMTAKAGDVIRRLRASLPISTITSDLGIPEAVLQGFDGICKQIEVVNSVPPSDVRDYCIDSISPPPPPPPPPPPAIAPKGDGFSLTYVNGKLYNLFHHNEGLVVLCHNLDLSECGFSTDAAYLTGVHSHLVNVNNKLYFSARVLAGGAPSSIGIGCYDPGSQTFCGFAALGQSNFSSPAPENPNGDYSAGVDNIILVGGKLYTMGSDNNGKIRMYCADPSGGTPVSCGGGSYNTGLDATPDTILNLSVGFSQVGQRILYNTSTTNSPNSYVGCFDTLTQGSCAGWPGGPIDIGVFNSDAMLIGSKLCMQDGVNNSPSFDVRCVDANNGSSVAPPPNFLTQTKPYNTTHPNVPWNNWDVDRDGTRMYISAFGTFNYVGAGAIYCYDTSIQNICSGWGRGNGWSDGSEVGNSFALALSYHVTRVGSCLYGIGDQPNPQIYKMSPTNAAPCP